MRIALLSILGAGLLAGLSLPARGQQPQAPQLPPINPAVARLEQTASGLDGAGLGIAYARKEGLLLAACEKHSLRCWGKDVAMGVRVGDRPSTVLKGHVGPVLAVDARAGTAASAGAGGRLMIWKLAELEPLHSIETGVALRTLAVSPDGKAIATTGDDGIVQLWDSTTGKPGATLQKADDWLLALAFSPDGKTIAAGGYDGRWHLWDIASGNKLRSVEAQPPAAANAPKPPPNVVQALAFSPDGKTLAVGGGDARIHLFQTADGKLTRSMTGHVSTITALAFHPSGTVLASSSKDHTIKLWNPANGQALKSLEGHTSWVHDLTFLIDGTRLASVGADQTLRLWSLTPPPQ